LGKCLGKIPIIHWDTNSTVEQLIVVFGIVILFHRIMNVEMCRIISNVIIPSICKSL
jgi:hypothetical protein